MILVKVFYDNNIHTTRELLSALISIEKQTDMKISRKKNKDGHALLAEYLSYKDQYKKTENESGELEKLILTDTPIEKAAKAAFLVYSILLLRLFTGRLVTVTF